MSIISSHPTPFDVELPEPVKPVVPDHELVRLIGRGSYGDVWLARNVMGTYRAVKSVYRSRFKERRPYERELEGIRKYEPVSRTFEGFIDILQVGRNDEEEYFYYVMELGDDAGGAAEVDSGRYEPRTLDKSMRRGVRMEYRRCLEAGLSLALALRHLHAKGLVHRDIKPSNILYVGGQPKLADIGLVTDMGEGRSYVGTEGYIPPEGPGTPQADVYALGKVLYEMATGRDRHEFPKLPEDFDTLPDKEHFLELNDVLLKACQNDVQHRYQSAEDMHAELALLDNGKSVRRLRLLESRLAKAKRWVAATAAVMLVGFGAFWLVNREWEREEDARQRQAGSSVAYGTQAMAEGDLLGALPHYLEAMRLDRGDRVREDAHRLRFGSILSQTPRLTHFWLASKRLEELCFSPDGRRLAGVEQWGKVWVWEVEDMDRPPLSWKIPEAMGVDFSPDGERLLVASSRIGAVEFDARDGRELGRWEVSRGFYKAKYSPDGRRWAGAGRDRNARVKDLASGQELVLKGHTNHLLWVSFSPDGRWLVSAGQDGQAYVWDTATGERRFDEPFRHENWIYSAQFSPDGAYLATSGFDRVVKIWDLMSGQEMRPPLRHGDGILKVEYTPDRRYLVTSGFDSVVRYWDAETHLRVPMLPLLPHSHRTLAMTVSPEGRRVATGCEDKTVRIWDLAGAVQRPWTAAGKLSGDGSHYGAWRGSGWEVVRLKDERVVAAAADVGSTIEGLVLDERGQHVLVKESGPAGRATVSRTGEGGGILGRMAWDYPLNGTLISEDGQWVAGWESNRLEVTRTVDGRAAFPRREYSSKIGGLVFTRKGDLLAVGVGHRIYLLETATGEVRPQKFEFPATVSFLQFDPTETRLVASCLNTTTGNLMARVWNVADGSQIGSDYFHYDGVTHAAFHPDGRHLITTGEDDVAILWDMQTGKRLRPVMRHGNDVLQAMFGRQGHWVLTMGEDWVIRIWDTVNREPLTPELHHPTTLRRARLLESGDRVAAVAEDLKGIVYRWPLVLDGRSWEDLSRVSLLLSGVRSDESGELLPPSEAELIESWTMMRAKYRKDFSVSEDEVVDWHRRQAADHEKAGNLAGGRFHRNILETLDPATEVASPAPDAAGEASVAEN